MCHRGEFMMKPMCAMIGQTGKSVNLPMSSIGRTVSKIRDLVVRERGRLLLLTGFVLVACPRLRRDFSKEVPFQLDRSLWKSRSHRLRVTHPWWLLRQSRNRLEPGRRRRRLIRRTARSSGARIRLCIICRVAPRRNGSSPRTWSVSCPPRTRR